MSVYKRTFSQGLKKLFPFAQKKLPLTPPTQVAQPLLISLSLIVIFLPVSIPDRYDDYNSDRWAFFFEKIEGQRCGSIILKSISEKKKIDSRARFSTIDFLSRCLCAPNTSIGVPKSMQKTSKMETFVGKRAASGGGIDF